MAPSSKQQSGIAWSENRFVRTANYAGVAIIENENQFHLAF
jgi:hypothetical protein